MFDNLAIVDVETTGGNPIRDRIIEIGIIRIQGGAITEEFETLINPNCYIPPQISMLTGISPGDLETAPSFRAVYEDIYRLLDGAVFVAHNVRFDYGFVKSEMNRLEKPYSAKQLCTAKLSRRLFPKYRHHNLDSIMERFTISCVARHRAMGDAKVLWEFLKKLTPLIDTELLNSTIRSVSKDAVLPPGISRDVVERIPESPGVYSFYNAEGTVLYIGKSINLKDRILSHFASASTDPKEARIYTTIASLEYTVTNGELGALLEESRLIKQYKPLYNRQLRETQGIVVCKKSQRSDGYFTVSLEEKKAICPEEVPYILSVFRTMKQAKTHLHDLAAQFSLCKKMLGIEKTTGACFGFQLKTCHGACIRKEIPAKHNMRFIGAFKKTKVKQWPFAGMIAIHEGDTTHLVSHWCYLGIQSDDRLAHHTDNENTYTFDYDTYKILSRFILNPSSQKYIKNIQSANYMSTKGKSMLAETSEF